MKKKRRTYIEPKKQKGKQGRILAVCHLDMIFFVSVMGEHRLYKIRTDISFDDVEQRM